MAKKKPQKKKLPKQKTLLSKGNKGNKGNKGVSTNTTATTGSDEKNMEKFDITLTSNIDRNSKLVYNYYNTTIGSSDVDINDTGKLNNYTINVSYPANTPNALYPDSLGTYNARKIHLSGLVHNNIQQVSTNNTIGELIIEHNALTGSGKLFICILLNYSPSILSDKNSVDDLIYVATSNDKRQQITLNSSIPSQQSAIVYIDNGNKIVVFTSPLYISSNSYNKIKKLSIVNLFNEYSYEYKIITQNNILMTGKDEIYIDCSPTGASSQEIATYNVPINSEYTQDAGKLDFMKTTVNLCLIFIILLITYFSVPFLYKISIIDIIEKLIPDDTKQLRNITIDITLSFVAFIIFISVISDAAKSDNFDKILYGVYFIIFCLLSVAIIGYNKTTGYFKHPWVQNIEFQYDKLFNEIIQYYGELGLFIFKGPDESYINIIRISVLYIITLFILLILRYGSKSISKRSFGTYTGVMLLLITFGVSMVSLLNR